MKHLRTLALAFLAGCVFLALGFLMIWARWPWDPGDDDIHWVGWPVIVGVSTATAITFAWGFLATGQSRWGAFALSGFLITGLGVLWTPSVGILLLPIGVGLLFVSVARLVLYGLFDRAVDRD